MKPLFAILFFFIMFISKAQNLVPNPSFEQFDTCPNFMGQIRYSLPWFNYNNSQTPDYFNSCAIATWSTPNNSAGYQIPYNGNAYAGLYTFIEVTPNYREYITTQLLSPLIIGQKYYLKFKINLANGTTGGTNKIGALFSSQPYYFEYSTPFYKNFAQIYTDSMVLDTINWTTISGSFIADSTYSYLSVGNFFDSFNTDCVAFDSSSQYCIAYYYIDNVCVSTDSLTCNQSSAIAEINSVDEVFNVYPNPSVNEITIDIKEHFKSSNVIFYDILGKKYREFTILPNAKQINISNFNAGIYFIQLNINNKSFYKKVIINH